MKKSSDLTGSPNKRQQAGDGSQGQIDFVVAGWSQSNSIELYPAKMLDIDRNKIHFLSSAHGILLARRRSDKEPRRNLFYVVALKSKLLPTFQEGYYLTSDKF